jgi:uncharacterized protein (TIGR02145 family)
MKHLLFSLMSLISTSVFSQIGFGTTHPQSSAAIDITSTTKGLLPPRLTYIQKNAIEAPVAGLLLWCTNCGSSGELQVYNGSTWTNMTGGIASLAKPSAPTSPVATAGNQQASIVFNTPESTGGSAITGYTVTSSPGGFTETGSSSPLVVTGLTNGTSYTFSVVATNVVGNSDVSVASAAVTPYTIPGAPTSPVATPENQQASVAFTVPVSNGFSTITGYTVTSSPGSFTATGASAPLVVTGLTAGTSYTFTVVATNAAGNSVASAASNAVTPYTVPGAPTIGTATAGNEQASIAFTAPASNGFSTITGYTVTSTPGGFTTTGASSPLVVTGLTAGTSYTFTVVATNVAGNSVASDASNAVTPLCSSTVTFTYNGASVTYGVITRTISGTTKCWLDRNLGAVSGSASSPTDPNGWGDLFQWGRGADGHQLRSLTSVTTGSSTTTTIKSTTDVPANPSFILNSTGGDWRSTPNSNLWQGLDGGINNPCPTGFRLPTSTEFLTELNSYNTGNIYAYFGASPLKFAHAGYRLGTSGVIAGVLGTGGCGSGGCAYYWTSTISSNLTKAFSINFVFTVSSVEFDKATGASVRCIKD